MIDKNRRAFLQAVTVASLGIAAAPALKAADIVKVDDAVDPESPQAKALGYVHHYSEVETERFPRFEEGQICANCQLAQGNLEKDWFGCAIFPSQLVAREGWCSAWVQMR